MMNDQIPAVKLIPGVGHFGRDRISNLMGDNIAHNHEVLSFLAIGAPSAVHWSPANERAKRCAEATTCL